MHNSFIDGMQKVINDSDPNIAVTENGAIGYETTGKCLLDLNFKLSSMRNWPEPEILSAFMKAYNEYPVLAIVWLFFARDVRGGCGERRTFRVIMTYLANENTPLFTKLLCLIPEYGRWDDVIWLYGNIRSRSARTAIVKMIKDQLDEDTESCREKKPVSLLAKWAPSINTSSNETRRIANMLRADLGLTAGEYRKRLASLRKYLNVVEQMMSAKKWDEINYEAVPSKAGITYRNAFSRHDEERYDKYLEDVNNGTAKMNSGAIFPYEIVHAYMDDSDFWRGYIVREYDETLEQKWKSLPDTVKDDPGTLVVVDGSGSMDCRVGSTITAHDVARSIGIYFAERLKGAFKNSFITFSAKPKLVVFDGAESLMSKISILAKEQDCSNTNLKATFDLILRTAIQNNMSQQEMPANILIISDMEFDGCSTLYDWSAYTDFDNRLFSKIKQDYELAGYKVPRLVFWNVNSRSGAIPVKENDLGVALVSGFSPNIADMVMSGEVDPWKNLVTKLRSERYDDVWKVVMPS